MSPQHELSGYAQNYWTFDPNLYANYTFVALFGCTMAMHTLQGIHHRRKDSWIIITSALWQFSAYIARGLSIHFPSNQWLFLAWNSLMMVRSTIHPQITTNCCYQTAPLWTNAFIYVLVGHLICQSPCFSRRAETKVRGWHISAGFVMLDIVAFAIQATGIILAILPQSVQTMNQGLYIYLAGISSQQLFILFFSFLLWKSLQSQESKEEQVVSTGPLWPIFAALALISVRIIFRLIEYSGGINSSISRQEAYAYAFDSVPMLLALWLFNVYHPGRTGVTILYNMKLAGSNVSSNALYCQQF
ncbi:hypothetical protein DE146DRAFT_627343 [Phaeosphaeria sp. MPI-PUGE-AT-0046c]|nr:hypothetical protein DE146DRAFT_627343 [Phaeosphaeria sp. MPI-PUGE-AT-0046c]